MGKVKKHNKIPKYETSLILLHNQNYFFSKKN